MPSRLGSVCLATWHRHVDTEGHDTVWQRNGTKTRNQDAALTKCGRPCGNLYIGNARNLEIGQASNSKIRKARHFKIGKTINSDIVKSRNMGTREYGIQLGSKHENCQDRNPFCPKSKSVLHKSKSGMVNLRYPKGGGEFETSRCQ